MLLCNTKPNSSADRRIPLVISWHHKFRDISRILRNNYDMITSKYPDLKKVFPNPPMVAFRRTTNIKDLVVTAKHWKNTKELPKVSKSLIANCMNITGKITNKKLDISCNIPKGKPSSTNVVYAAECKKCELLYVGSTEGLLSTRFNGHRSDITCYPDRCELPHHFKQNGFTFSTDLEVSVLENFRGTKLQRLRREDIWTEKLNTRQPNGLNSKISEFNSIHKALHNLP